MKTSYVIKAVSFAWSRGRKWIILNGVISIVNGFSPLITLYVVTQLINEVSLLFQGENLHYDKVVSLLLLQLTLQIVLSILQNITFIMDSYLENKIRYDLEKEISIKAATVPLMYYEIPEFYNHLDRISLVSAHNIIKPIKSILRILQSVATLISYLGFLFYIHWSLVLFSLLGSLIVLFTKAKFGSMRFGLMFSQTPKAREANYIRALLQERESAKEIRAFGLSDFLLQRWSILFLANSKEMLQLNKKSHWASVWLDSVTEILYACAIGVVILVSRYTTLSIGQFVSGGQAIKGTQSALNNISDNLATIYENNLYIYDLFNFLEFEDDHVLEREKSLESYESRFSGQDGIIFDKVSFQYPNSNKNVLDDISIHIKPGEKVAIVGENGSGKTTFVKCLMGLYPVSKGQIYVGTENINYINKKELRKKISVIFQDFVRYAFTVRDNITFGDINNHRDADRLDLVGERTGVHSFVQRFKKKYDTPLGKVLTEGEDLSGGQWQKVALARALFRDSKIIIFDEPTAALDPKAERDVYEQFHIMSEGKTAIFISHRMAITKFVDRILVMKDGKLIEAGSHDELYKRHGEYYQMYEIQAKWYA
ncbi:ABC transporter ATP-binding protein [Aneurinibacillus migulanus]|uniref:ABC transporter ATP-binding protein n=1 Tax=Aneurinibacillus migulanus TaxID=47500 RepID=UPI002E1F3D1F|nr:ABC transporter ATP-binding protein [Aneurinibacillus migulanus]